MVGVRLEVDVDIVTGSTTTVANLVKSVNKAGLEVLGILTEAFTTTDAVITEDERQLGVILVDVGAGTTDISFFKNNRLVYSNLIPVAGKHITNDISIGLRISLKESEDLKKKYGLASVSVVNNDEKIEINPIGINEKIHISQYQLTEIIEARVTEIFDMINYEINKKGLRRDILTGIVVTGGGVSYLRGIEDLGKRIFGLPVRIGQPNYIGVKEPIFSTSVGMVNYVLKRKFDYFIEYNNVDNKKSRYKNKTKSNINMVSLVKKVWNEYF